MTRKSDQQIIAESISPIRESSEPDFQEGHCGTYALALHDATKGKAKLGMIRGSRPDEDVQVHSYVQHPTKPGHGIDSQGEFKISDRADAWKENHHPDEYEDADHDGGDHYDRPKFVSALKQTGAPDHEKGAYDAALKHIHSSGVLKHFK